MLATSPTPATRRISEVGRFRRQSRVPFSAPTGPALRKPGEEFGAAAERVRPRKHRVDGDAAAGQQIPPSPRAISDHDRRLHSRDVEVVACYAPASVRRASATLRLSSVSQNPRDNEAKRVARATLAAARRTAYPSALCPRLPNRPRLQALTSSPNCWPTIGQCRVSVTR